MYKSLVIDPNFLLDTSIFNLPWEMKDIVNILGTKLRVYKKVILSYTKKTGSGTGEE